MSVGAVCVSLAKGFTLCLSNSTESTNGVGGYTLQNALVEFYKGSRHWLQLIPANPDSKRHCLSTTVHNWLLSTFMADCRKLLSTSVFTAFG